MPTPSPRLHHEQVGDPEAPRVAFVVHGILGSGRNLRSLARQLVSRHPDWRIVLPDLRNHGRSPAMPPPHTVAAAAGDLADLTQLVGAPEAVIGHSFGGKVALAYARDRDPGKGLRHVAVLDARPDAGHGSPDVRRVIEVVRAAPVGHRGQGQAARPASRDAIRSHLAAHGLSPAIISWLLTSTARSGDDWIWTWNLDGVQEMLQDYLALDLLPFVRSLPVGLRALFVRAGRSDRWDRGIVEALEGAERVDLALIRDAGHWLHAEDPEAVLRALAPLFEVPPMASGPSER